ncbi:MAG: cysteine desulfurase [Alphaproteobacteria bacterium]|nr:cysteine desulfurase [Alphaproteobacteria bacterium]
MTGSAPELRVVGQRSGFDVARVRADFPILAREVNGKPLVYLDSAASAQKPLQVIEAMDHAMRFEYANVHRGIHYLSNTATQKYEDARETARRFLNARSAAEIIFTKNATEAINLVAYSWGRENIGEGDEIIISVMEHHANIVPWHFLREHQGAVLKWAPVADNGEFLLDELERMITPRTKIIALSHMSNVLGTVVPMGEVARLARKHGVKLLVDASQSCVHMSVDVQALDCDFLVFTGHKVYGPSGIGVLYGRRELLEVMPPFLGGGAMIESVGRDEITYGPPPERFEAGTPPIVEAVGLGAALDYMMQIGRDQIAVHEASLSTYAHEQLDQLNWLTIHGRAPGKGGIIAFTMDGLHPHDISMVVDRSGVAIRAGHHCAQPLMERFGVPAMCRASFGVYNTRDDVDVLVEALKKAHDLFA